MKSYDELKKYMSPAYWEMWNDDEQARIDADIEKYRKADACELMYGIPAGTEVKVEQISHDFIFGAHIFNFNQLFSKEANARYKELYGTLFNSATIPFYWRTLEPEEGHVRFDAAEEDSEEWWIACKDPKHQKHYRRPAVEPIVQFCLEKGIRLHGHVLTWGCRTWQIPDWLLNKLPEPYRSDAFKSDNGNCHGVALTKGMSVKQIEKELYDYVEALNQIMARRIIQIAHRYGEVFHSWDVVNESAKDFGDGVIVPEENVIKSWYGLMPGEMDFRSFMLARAFFPARAKLNINDYYLEKCYAEQTKRLLSRGCKVDIMGLQMHLFNPQDCLDIAEGKTNKQSPEFVRNMLAKVHVEGVPTHLSEITITSPGGDERGEAIQAVIARNLYRLWFSSRDMMGITWWNVVDGLGAPGEPAISGLFHADMTPKESYHVLNHLIHTEWKTNLTAQVAEDGYVRFRGFRGKYRLSWTLPSGERCERIIENV